jgi:hypothetical protein
MLQCTPPFGIILKLLAALRVAFRACRTANGSRPARHSPNRRTALKHGCTYANVVRGACRPAPPLPGPATRFTTLDRRAATPPPQAR